MRCGCWIFVSIALTLAGCGAGAKRDAPLPLTVSITTHLGDGQTFRAGDPLSFFISLDSDAHVLLLYEDASGAVSQLVPNPAFDRTFVAAGEFISMPPAEASFTFRVSEPFGTERVWLIASDQSLPGLPGRPTANGVTRVEGNATAIRQRLQDHVSRNGVRYGEASVAITTQP